MTVLFGIAAVLAALCCAPDCSRAMNARTVALGVGAWVAVVAMLTAAACLFGGVL